MCRIGASKERRLRFVYRMESLEPHPTLDQIRKTAARISPFVLRTPIVRWPTDRFRGLLSSNVSLKLELLQRTGTFKARGALSSVLSLSRADRAAGITAVSAGNHAIAAAYAASVTGTTAKVVMIDTASPVRIEAARSFGAEVVLAESGEAAFTQMDRIRAEEGRTVIHPFDGAPVALGTGTLGLEILAQLPRLDALVIAVGGGGLAGGVGAALKQLCADCRLYGVEPRGADNMSRSIAKGAPQKVDRVNTIADSLAPPFSMQYSFDLCKSYLDDIVLVDDDEIRTAMGLFFEEAKLAVEPAGAAALAAALGPLRERLRGRNVCVLVCGSNIDAERYFGHIGQSDSPDNGRARL